MKKSLRTILFALSVALVSSVDAQSRWGASPADSAACVQNLSLFQEFMKQGNFKDAYPPYRELLRICPTCSKSLHQNGVKLMDGLISTEKDQVRKDRLIDSLYLAYDMRIEHFGERAYVLGRKGVDMLIYRPGDCKAAFDVLKEAVDLGAGQSEAGTMSAYYQTLYCLYSKGEATKEQLLSDYVRLMGYIDAKLANPALKPADKEYVEMARGSINALFFQVAECADIGRIAGEMVKAAPADMDLKVRLLKVLNGKDCTDEALYRTLAEDVHRSSPTSESAYSLGMYMAKQGDMNGAMKYMKEAVDLCSGCSDKVKYLLKAGQVASANGNVSQSRSYANQVLQLDPKNGEALILVGNAILANAGSCEAPESWGVYWLAYDQYQRAKSVDAGVAEKANERMAICSIRFPTQSEAFFHQLTDGKPFQVTCGGLNEGTTVRTRK